MSRATERWMGSVDAAFVAALQTVGDARAARRERNRAARIAAALFAELNRTEKHATDLFTAIARALDEMPLVERLVHAALGSIRDAPRLRAALATVARRAFESEQPESLASLVTALLLVHGGADFVRSAWLGAVIQRWTEARNLHRLRDFLPLWVAERPQDAARAAELFRAFPKLADGAAIGARTLRAILVAAPAPELWVALAKDADVREPLPVSPRDFADFDAAVEALGAAIARARDAATSVTLSRWLVAMGE